MTGDMLFFSEPYFFEHIEMLLYFLGVPRKFRKSLYHYFASLQAVPNTDRDVMQRCWFLLVQRQS